MATAGSGHQNAVPVIIGAVIATAAVAIGFGRMPYDYYMLLRIFLSGFSLFLLAGTSLALPDWQRWTLGGLAILYNPVLPVRLGSKDVWEALNVGTVLLFWVVAFRACQPHLLSSSEGDNSETSQDLKVADSARERRMHAERQVQEERQRREEHVKRLRDWQERVYRK